jgi:hypothetical protein
MHVSDDDGFVRPRTGGSRLGESVVTFESASTENHFFDDMV